MKPGLALLGVFALLLAGCGGGGDGKGNDRGGVAGIIFDEEGFPVRDAHVYFDGPNRERKETQSNSNGVYELPDLPTGDQMIRVETNRDGSRYFGSNVARIIGGEKTQNLNIAAYPDNRLATIEGYVRDREGFLLKGVRVFAKQSATNTVLTSSYALTDGDGHYVLGGLRANLTYDVQVNALDYNSDFDTVTLNAGEIRRLEFTIPYAENITLAPPTNVVATAWTSPKTRAKGWDEVLENVKRLVKPGSKPKQTTRDTSGGNYVEIDTTWDVVFDQALLGYGIYRADSGGSFRDIYFLRDPLAELFADLDTNLREGRNYSYRISSIATNGKEGSLSASVTATPLGDLILRSTSGGNRPIFRWENALGANGYTVYLFDRYPSIGVQDFWNSGAPRNATSIEYDGAGSLSSGTYYYLVIGSSSTSNYTVSPVGSFKVL